MVFNQGRISAEHLAGRNGETGVRMRRGQEVGTRGRIILPGPASTRNTIGGTRGTTLPGPASTRYTTRRTLHFPVS